MMHTKSSKPQDLKIWQSWFESFDKAELARQGWSTGQLLDLARQNDYAYWMDNGEVSAAVFYHFVEESKLEVLFLGVPPGLRRRGHMLALMQRLAESQSGLTLWLECRADNAAAIELYGKLGFREVGRRPKYYKDGTTAILFNF